MKKTLAQYIKEVDKKVHAYAGLSVHDLPDYDFASAMEDDISPSEVANDILTEEGFYDRE